MKEIDLKKHIPEVLVIMFFIVSVTAFITYAIITTKQREKENLSFHFNGVVDSVRYDIKGIPFVVANDEEYYLSDGYDFNRKIQKGDSLIKEKNATTYILIKKNNLERLEFDN